MKKEEIYPSFYHTLAEMLCEVIIYSVSQLMKESSQLRCGRGTKQFSKDTGVEIMHQLFKDVLLLEKRCIDHIYLYYKPYEKDKKDIEYEHCIA